MLKKTIQDALVKVAHRIREKAIDEAPYITGALKKSITVDDSKPDEVIVWAGGGSAPYAPFVHEGTKPHIIRPKKKKALANKKAGILFGKKVNHPGNKPNQFLLRGAKKVVPEIDRLIGNDIAKAVSEGIKRQLKDIKIDIKI